MTSKTQSIIPDLFRPSLFPVPKGPSESPIKALQILFQKAVQATNQGENDTLAAVLEEIVIKGKDDLAKADLVRIMAKRAEILEQNLNKPMLAAWQWEQIAALDPANQQANKSLETFYRKRGQKGPLAKVLQRRVLEEGIHEAALEASQLLSSLGQNDHVRNFLSALFHRGVRPTWLYDQLVQLLFRKEDRERLLLVLLAQLESLNRAPQSGPTVLYAMETAALLQQPKLALQLGATHLPQVMVMADGPQKLWRLAAELNLTTALITEIERTDQQQWPIDRQVNWMGQVGRLYLGPAENATEAEKWFNRVLAQSPDQLDALWGLAMSFERQGKLDFVRQTVAAALTGDRTDGERQQLLSYLGHLVARQPQGAVEAVSLLAEGYFYNPTEALAIDLEQTIEQLGAGHKTGIGVCDHMVATAIDENVKSRWRLLAARWCELAGARKEAGGRLMKLLNDHPHHLAGAERLIQLGVQLGEPGWLANALPVWLDQVGHHHRQRKMRLVQYGDALVSLGRLEEADNLFAQGMTHYPEDPVFVDRLRSLYQDDQGQIQFATLLENHLVSHQATFSQPTFMEKLLIEAATIFAKKGANPSHALNLIKRLVTLNAAGEKVLWLMLDLARATGDRQAEKETLEQLARHAADKSSRAHAAYDRYCIGEFLSESPRLTGRWLSRAVAEAPENERYRLAYGELATTLGDKKNATRQYEFLLEHPTHLVELDEILLILADLGTGEDDILAKERLDALRVMYPFHEEGTIRLARWWIDHHRPETARDLIRGLNKHHTAKDGRTDARRWAVQGIAEEALGNRQSAALAFEQAACSDATIDRVSDAIKRLFAVDAFSRLTRLVDATKGAARLLTGFDKRAFALALAAIDDVRATRLLNTVLKEQGTDPQVLRALIKSTTDHQQRATLQKRLLPLSPDKQERTSLMAALGDQESEKNNLALAIEWFEQAFSLSPTDKAIGYRLTDLYRQQENMAGVSTTLQKLLPAAKDNPTAGSKICLTLSVLERHHEGLTGQTTLQWIQKGLALDPTNESLIERMEQLLRDANDNRGLARLYRWVLKMDTPGKGASKRWIKLGDLYLATQKSWRRAYRAYHQALIVDPQSVDAAIRILNLLQKVPNQELTILDTLHRLIAIAPQPERWIDQLATRYERRGEHHAAAMIRETVIEQVTGPHVSPLDLTFRERERLMATGGLPTGKTNDYRFSWPDPVPAHSLKLRKPGRKEAQLVKLVNRAAHLIDTKEVAIRISKKAKQLVTLTHSESGEPFIAVDTRARGLLDDPSFRFQLGTTLSLAAQSTKNGAPPSPAEAVQTGLLLCGNVTQAMADVATRPQGDHLAQMLRQFAQSRKVAAWLATTFDHGENVHGADIFAPDLADAALQTSASLSFGL